jgi:hypothetical protein
MIIYSPTDGDALMSTVKSMPQHCFLITKLGGEIPPELKRMRTEIARLCHEAQIKTIDATHHVTGRDVLIKIWRLIAATPISIAVCHESFPPGTLANIYYEIGVAQAMGKETLIVKSPGFTVASDLVRTEYIEFNDDFIGNFSKFLADLSERADHYEMMAEQLERNPILSLDYLKRAFLISGNTALRRRAKSLLAEVKKTDRAKNSVEVLAASF